MIKENPNRAPARKLIERCGVLMALVAEIRATPKDSFENEGVQTNMKARADALDLIIMEAQAFPGIVKFICGPLPKPPPATKAEGQPDKPPPVNARYKFFIDTLTVIENNLGVVKSAVTAYEAGLKDEEVPNGADAPDPGHIPPRGPAAPKAEPKAKPPPAEEPRAAEDPKPEPAPAPEDPHAKARARWSHGAKDPEPEKDFPPPPPKAPEAPKAKGPPEVNSGVPLFLIGAGLIALGIAIIWVLQEPAPSNKADLSTPKAPETVSKGQALDCSAATPNVELDGVTYTVIPVHDGDTTLFIEGWAVEDRVCVEGDMQGGTWTVTTNDFAELRKGLQAKLGANVPSGMTRVVEVAGRKVRCNAGFVENGCFE